MKNIIATICCFIFLQSLIMAQASWKSSEYKPEPYRKVMVLARISDKTARKQLEDYTVKFLTDKGIVAIQAYLNVRQAHVESREAFLAIADSLQVDALLVYAVEGAEKRVENTPSVSVGVGVGMYGGYAGASVPISGGAKMVTVVKLSADFYNRAATGEQWTLELSGKLEEHTDKLAYSLAKSTVKTMLKDGLFVGRK